MDEERKPVDISDLGAWFRPEELEPCPACGERRAVPRSAPAGALRICLNCGLVKGPAET